MTEARLLLDVAGTGAELVSAAEELIDGSPYVALVKDSPAISELAAMASEADRPDWSWYLSDKGLPVHVAAFEYAFNAALNGGYFQIVDGEIRQWESRGSGSVALAEWVEALHRDIAFPGVSLEPSHVDDIIGPRVKGLPHAKQRLEVCRQFSDLDRYCEFRDFILTCYDAPARTWRFDLAQADALAAMYPAGFGGDPFRKKAILTFLMLAGTLEGRGDAVDFRLPIPSDYQIPRILEWKGAIQVSEALEGDLRSGRLLDAASDPVAHLRAAAVVVARKIGKLAGKSDDVVDGTLFVTFRKDEDFKANALPPARCDSMWF